MPDALVVYLGLAVLVLFLWLRRKLDALRDESRLLRRRVSDLELRLGGEPAEPTASTSPRTTATTAVPSTAPTAEGPPTAPRRPAGARPPVAAVSGSGPSPAAVPSVPVAKPVQTPRPSLEVFLGGRVMLVVGIVVVLFGLAFFLKVAIDKGWIGPGARIAMGVAAGIALLVGGDRLRGRGLAVFGHGLMGGGLGALYLSNYFAASWFGLLDRSIAFACVAALTALGAWLAVWRDARLLAWLGFLGAFLAPALLGRGEDALEELATWLVVVDLGLLAVLVRRAWPRLEIMALTASTVYFWAWFIRWFERVPTMGRPDRTTAANVVLCALLLTLFALCLVPAWVRRGVVSATSLGTVLVGSLLAFAAGHSMLFPASRGVLGTAVLIVGGVFVAAGYGLAARRNASRDSGAPRNVDTETLDNFSLVALAVAIPVLLGGHALAPAWAFAGAAAVIAGCRLQRASFQYGGMVMVLLAAGHVVTKQMPLHDAAFLPLLNLSFLSAVSPGVALLLAARFLRQPESAAGPVLRTPVLLAGAWLIALLLGVELHDHFLLDADRYGPAARDYGLSAAAMGLAACAVVFATLLGRGEAPQPAAGVVPLLFALLAASVVNFQGLRPDFSLLFNVPFAAGLFVTAAAFVLGRVLVGDVRVWALGAAALFFLALITSELITYGEVGALGSGTREEARFRAQVYISVAWGLYAAVLLSLGFVRDSKELRWAALGVFALTLAKVLLMDMAQLDTLYRIGSFLAVGVLLVSASFLYQRVRTPAEPDDLSGRG